MTSQIPQRPMFQKGQKPAPVPAIRKASRGQSCTLRIPGVCSGDTAQTRRLIAGLIRLG